MEDFSVIHAMNEEPPYDNLVHVLFTSVNGKSFQLDKSVYLYFSYCDDKLELMLLNKRGSWKLERWIRENHPKIEILLSNYHGNVREITAEALACDTSYDMQTMKLVIYSQYNVTDEYSKEEDDFEYLIEVPNE